MTKPAPRKGAPLDDAHHVFRHVTGKQLTSGVVDGEAFKLRKDIDEQGASVWWKEWFDPPIDNQLNEVRRANQRQVTSTHRLVLLNVGVVRATINKLKLSGLAIDVVHDPLPENPPFPADPSHAEIIGYAHLEDLDAQTVQDAIAACAIEPYFPAKAQTNG